MSDLSRKELSVIQRMCKEKVDGKVRDYYIKNGKIYRQEDDLHSIDDGCGCCWRRISLGKLKRNESDDSMSD